MICVVYQNLATFISAGLLDAKVGIIPLNKAISDNAPNIYFSKAWQQCKDKNVVLGNISDNDLLLKNLEENCIPSNVKNMTVIDYEVFLQERRNMMAKLIEKYYKGL